MAQTEGVESEPWLFTGCIVGNAVPTDVGLKVRIVPLTTKLEIPGDILFYSYVISL